MFTSRRIRPPHIFGQKYFRANYEYMEAEWAELSPATKDLNIFVAFWKRIGGITWMERKELQ
jgi:hypothetical protein